MTSYTLQVQPRAGYTIEYANQRGPQGATGPAGAATTDASLLTTGTLPDARLSSNIQRMMFAASASARASKLKICAGVVRPTRSGTSLTWAWLDDADHAPVGFGAISSSSANLVLNFDTTYSKAITAYILPDEFFQKYGFQCGVSLGLSAMTITMTADYNSVTSYSHNGTSWSNAASSSHNFVTAVSVASNITTLTLADYGASSASSQFSHSIPIYHGSNNRYARMVNSGLAGNQVRFELIDPATGSVAAPASGDRISLQNPNPRVPVDLATVSSTGLGQDFFQDSAITGNFWVFAIMEEA